MKYTYTLLSFLLLLTTANAQWTAQNTGTTANLKDIHFKDAMYGIAVGDSGTILRTTDGGINWELVQSNVRANLGAVYMISPDSVLVSTAEQFPTLYLSLDSGRTLGTPAFVDSGCFRAIDMTVLNNTLFTIGSNLLSTGDGVTYDTLFSNTCGTTGIDRIDISTNNTINAGGLISGILTYSAYMLRSNNGGQSFYSVDPFSFPNADALTAFHFPTSDTGYIFMNQYSGFMPGTVNSLVKTYDYQLVSQFTDSVYTFTSTIINNALPAYMNDGYFVDSQTGYAAGEDGIIYKTTDGGLTWTADYTGSGALKRISYIDSSNAYVAGDAGQIIKISTTTSLGQLKEKQINVYPNPASDFITVEGLDSDRFTYTLTDTKGAVVAKGKYSDSINISFLPKGSYTLQLTDGKEKASKIVIRN